MKTEILSNSCGMNEPYVAKATERVEITVPIDSEIGKVAKDRLDRQIADLQRIPDREARLTSAYERSWSYPDLFHDWGASELGLSAPQYAIDAFDTVNKFERQMAEDQIRNLNNMVTANYITVPFDLEIRLEYDKRPDIADPLKVAITVNEHSIAKTTLPIHFDKVLTDPHHFAELAANLGTLEVVQHDRGPASYLTAKLYDEVESKLAQAIEYGITKLVVE